MNTLLTKYSPVLLAQKTLSPEIGEYQGMQTVLSFPNQKNEIAHKKILGLTDLSCLPRFGIKGSSAETWLLAQGLAAPSQFNSWVEGPQGVLVLRLGSSEFLIEDQLNSTFCQKLLAFNQAEIPGAYQVARADAALVLSGSEVLSLLSEVCVLDLRDSKLADQQVVMTQIAGISATLIRQSLNDKHLYRIWCDGTYGVYMWETLYEIAQELGGGAVGFNGHFQ